MQQLVDINKWKSVGSIKPLPELCSVVFDSFNNADMKRETKIDDLTLNLKDGKVTEKRTRYKDARLLSKKPFDVGQFVADEFPDTDYLKIQVVGDGTQQMEIRQIRLERMLYTISEHASEVYDLYSSREPGPYRPLICIVDVWGTSIQVTVRKPPAATYHFIAFDLAVKLLNDSVHMDGMSFMKDTLTFSV